MLDLSQQLPGPYATLLLATLGARVIKIEPPQTDIARTLDPDMFQRVNAGKESVVLDLKQPSDQATLHEMAGGADVLVEGFRPGTTRRLGAGYETIAAIRPDIIYCSISGFGAGGPYRDVPGHDVNYLGVAGGLGPDQLEPAPPAEIGIPMVDMATGTMAALSVLGALINRSATGRGAYLDVAMLDSAVFWSRVKDQHLTPSIGEAEPTYGVWRAADGQRLSLGVLEDKFWRGLCAALEWDEWGVDPAYATHAARRRHADEIHSRLTAAIAGRPRDEWLARLLAHDVPAAAVNEPAAAADDPQVRFRGLISRSDGRPALLTPPVPSVLRRTPARTAPGPGEHTTAVRSEFGPSEHERPHRLQRPPKERA